MLHDFDTQIYGVKSDPLVCRWCGADLTNDIEFQQAHMERVHRIAA